MTAQAHRIIWVAATLAVLLQTTSPRAGAFPEPSIVTKAWQYDFTYDPPRPISIRALGGGIQWFWYITYKVINNTGDERLFVPEVTIYTDTGRIFPAGNNVPSRVFNAVKSRIANPLLENPAEIIGRVLQGPDYAKEGVAIWPAPSEDVDRLTVFFSGLSGEVQATQHPLTGERVVLRKTLMIEYEMPGTTTDIQEQPVVPVREQWTMR
jgi:hypothetical protein